MADSRMLIGGELVPSSSGATFDNVNPATEEVIGSVADATREDMERAVTAARSAFDQTEWSRDGGLRKKCLYQLKAAAESEVEELRAELISEVGCPILTTYGPQLDAPLREALTWPADTDRAVAGVDARGAEDPDPGCRGDRCVRHVVPPRSHRGSRRSQIDHN